MKKVRMNMKKLAAMILIVVTMLSMAAVPVSAKTVYGRSGVLKKDVTYMQRVHFTKKFFFHNTHTVTFKQKKGTAVYKKANGKTTTKKIYGKMRIVIKENDKKVVANKVLTGGSYKFKCKTNTSYAFYVSFEGVHYSDEVKFGPLYFDRWKKMPTFDISWFTF